jgi:hypothetical protein
MLTPPFQVLTPFFSLLIYNVIHFEDLSVRNCYCTQLKGTKYSCYIF